MISKFTSGSYPGLFPVASCLGGCTPKNALCGAPKSGTPLEEMALPPLLISPYATAPKCTFFFENMFIILINWAF